jgi:3-oxoacyl-[acyl-carrier protein] reductase
MRFDFQGQRVLVSGSSSGIGFGIANCFDEAGANVVLTGRNLVTLKAAQKNLKNAPDLFCGDLSESKDVERLAAEFPDVDVLVCNLGSGRSVPPGEEDMAEWRRVLELNFFSAVKLIEAYKTNLIRHRSKVVCISSICGNSALGAPATYSVAKSALNAYVNNMARYFGPLGVRINVVTPGNILFPESTWQKKMTNDADAVQTLLQKEVPLQCFGTPEDIGNACVFLASSYAKFITGTQLVVDGGQLRVI